MQEFEPLYEESIRLIDATPDLMTNKIPDHLLSVWLYNGSIVPNPPIEQLISVAIYKYANDKYGDPSISSEESHHRYRIFQYILATEYVCRKVSAKFTPRKIFDFSGYNKALNIDMKRNQVAAFHKLAATLVPLQNRSEIINDNSSKYWN